MHDVVDLALRVISSALLLVAVASVKQAHSRLRWPFSLVYRRHPQVHDDDETRSRPWPPT